MEAALAEAAAQGSMVHLSANCVAVLHDGPHRGLGRGQDAQGKGAGSDGVEAAVVAAVAVFHVTVLVLPLRRRQDRRRERVRVQVLFLVSREIVLKEIFSRASTTLAKRRWLWFRERGQFRLQ